MSDQEDHRPSRPDGLPTVSAYVIAYNEAEKVEAAISSVLWADEIVLADSHSTDGTAEIAERLGARVVQIDFDGFGRLRNEAIAACRGDWIFSLDSDERCTAEARDAILRIVADPGAADIGRVPRRNWFMGRWIRWSGWYPNFRQPQLFRNGRMTYDDLPVHEGWIPAEGARVETLPADIWQIPFGDLGEVQHKATLLDPRCGEGPGARWRRIHAASALVRGWLEFNKHYLIKLGFLDGWAGFVTAFAAAEGRVLQAREGVPEASRGETSGLAPTATRGPGRMTIGTSVVVSTYERPEALRAVLLGLSRQRDRNFEVIVADDGSGPGTAEVVERARDAWFEDRLHHVRQDDDGFRLARVRNLAARSARGERLVFLDGDCVPRPGFVGSHRRIGPGVATCGRRALLSSAATDRWLADVTRHPVPGPFGQMAMCAAEMNRPPPWSIRPWPPSDARWDGVGSGA